MIMRIWHGWTSHHDAEKYQRLLDDEIVPAITARAIPGLAGVDVLRRDADDDDDEEEVEFITIMAFHDWPAIETFAGPEYQRSVVPASARQLLRRFAAESQHYELVARHPAGRAGPPPKGRSTGAS